MKIILVIISILITSAAYSQDKGIINGTVNDVETQKPVEGVIIELVGRQMKTQTNTEGKFEFTSIPYGTYQIKATSLGYESITKTDIVVLSARPTMVMIDMSPMSYTTDVIDVESRYFQKSNDATTSTFNLDFEEIRRAPGAVEDISRMVQVLPGVSAANDQRNDLIVRGGSPSENMTIIDGIEVPNINHYPTQGSSSGPIGMINDKLISNINFSTGGFSARYGDKLSSVLDISFREGYRKKLLSDINLSTAGFGGTFEGPLFSKNGSFLFSVRKSYLNLIRGAIRLAAVPDYWDFNLKTVYDISKNTKLEFLGVGGLDKINFEGEASKISDENPYGKAHGTQQEFTAGFNLKNLFKSGYVQTTLSNSSSFFNYVNYDLRTDALIFENDAYESEFSLKSELFYQLSRANIVVLGINGRYIRVKNQLYFNQDTSAFGYVTPEVNIDTRKKYQKAGAFAQYTFKTLKDKLILNAGVRWNYFSGINEKNVVSPRLAISYAITSVTTFNASSGVYYQSPEYLWLTSDPRNIDLKFTRALHYVAGIEHLFASDLRLSIEAYYKKYDRYPVSVEIPTYVLINGGTENGVNFVGYATSQGFGYVRGIDFSLQKKLTGSGIYGMINYSLEESRITALAGGEKPGSFDYRHNIIIIAGYQLSNDWLVGLKFRYTTGRPYTPYDIAASTYAGHGVANFNNFNGARYKDYNRLDLRVDKKWNLKHISIVTYFELQNVFNTQNVYTYFWNQYRNEQSTIYQWAFLPVGGFSIQF